MFQSKAITALGQGIVALLATIIFPLAGFALLSQALAIDESVREQSAYYMPLCFFVLGFFAFMVAIWRLIVAHTYSKEVRNDGVNPELESFTDEDELEQEKLNARLDAQTIHNNEIARRES